MTTLDINRSYEQSGDVKAALEKIQACLTKSSRTLIGLTGGPGSGKSTLAAYLIEYFSKQKNTQVICLSMDGFHLSKAQLHALPNSDEAFARRGAPWTFDSAGFIERVKRIKQSYQLEDILWPSFDHALGDPIENDVSINKATKVVLIEGLYLLHQNDGWRESKALFDEHWFLDVPVKIAIERLANRHMQAWNFSHQQAMERINQSDGLNADLVANYKDHANWLLRV
jgi:pantothenate kinase